MLLGICALLMWRMRRHDRHINTDENRIEGDAAPGFAEDVADFEHGTEESRSEGKKEDRPRHALQKLTKPTLRRRPFLKRHDYLIGFFSLVITTVVAAVDWLPLQKQQASAVSVISKSSDTDRFKALIDTAGERRSSGEMELAMDFDREAFRVPNIPITDRAVPMINIAKTLIKQEQFDRAYWPALLASDLRPDRPEYVNPFAEVLIEVCELDQAVDRLNVLGIDKDERSHDLLERAEARRSECARN